MYLQTAIRKKIIKLMEETHINGNQLAFKAGIARSGINKFIRQETKGIKIETIALICEALNITLEEYFADPLFKDVQVKD